MSSRERCACGAKSECRIWGARFCWGCASDWRDAAPMGRTPDFYRTFTMVWVAARKARAA